MVGHERKFYTNKPYTETKLSYVNDELVDENGWSIMMAWEKDIMYKTAELLCHPNADFLNIGYGMGYIDKAAEAFGCRSHYIIENHPDVWEQMKKAGWLTLHHVTPLLGDWMDYWSYLPKFDFIFYDTWADPNEILYHKKVVELSKEKGTVSFFNNPRDDLQGLHMEKEIYDLLKENYWIEYVEIDLYQLPSFQKYFEQVKNQKNPDGAFYWSPDWKTYYVPILSLKPAPNVQPNWMKDYDLPKGKPGWSS